MLPIIRHPRLDFWVTLLLLSGFPKTTQTTGYAKNETWHRLVQFTAVFSAFAWVRVTTQSHYYSTPGDVFGLLFNTISGSSEGSGRKHTKCQIVPTSPTYATREMRLQPTLQHHLGCLPQGTYAALWTLAGTTLDTGAKLLPHLI